MLTQTEQNTLLAEMEEDDQLLHPKKRTIDLPNLPTKFAQLLKKLCPSRFHEEFRKLSTPEITEAIFKQIVEKRKELEVKINALYWNESLWLTLPIVLSNFQANAEWKSNNSIYQILSKATINEILILWVDIKLAMSKN